MRGALAAACVSLLTAGCGGAHLAHSVTGNEPLAFSRCMRSHGVTSYPDPRSGGTIPKESTQQLGVTVGRLRSAGRACSRLLPGGGAPDPAALRQSWSDFTRFARCVRSHGVRDWPDPTPYPAHPDRPTFDLPPDVAPGAPRVRAELDRCLPLLHGNNPQHLG